MLQLINCTLISVHLFKQLTLPLLGLRTALQIAAVAEHLQLLHAYFEVKVFARHPLGLAILLLQRRRAAPRPDSIAPDMCRFFSSCGRLAWRLLELSSWRRIEAKHSWQASSRHGSDSPRVLMLGGVCEIMGPGSAAPRLAAGAAS